MTTQPTDETAGDKQQAQAHDVRAIDPMTGLPMGAGAGGGVPAQPQEQQTQSAQQDATSQKSDGEQGEGHTPASNLPDDPDAQGLPSHVILPDAHAFKRDQLRARLLVSLAALAVLCLLVGVSTEYRVMYSLCAGGVALAVLVLAVRYFMARSKAAKQALTRQPRT